MDWELTSTAFADGERIPDQYTADGANVSPPLAWTDPPEGTVELALICDDPDAPRGTWNHWIVYGLSPDVTGLPEGVATDASVAEPALKQGVTSFRKPGYGGPSPPPGAPHRYQFTLYALSATTDLDPGATKDQVLAAIEGNELARTTLEGLYSR
ncbi:MAG: YbhB/YbcL family Raf kinase inhibitor-like protein [Armatimonadota bacterium]